MVTVRLGRGARLTGRVEQYGVGLAAITVRLGVPTADDKALDPYFWSKWDRSARETTTDADGWYVFGPLPYGTYEARCRRTTTVSVRATQIEVTTASPDPIVLALPGQGGLRGRVLAPPDASFDQIGVRVTPVGFEVDPEGFYRPLAEITPLDAEGRFEVVAARAGPVSVDLVFRGHATRLGEVEIPAGDVLAIDFDARHLFPGRILVALLVDGEPEFGHTAWALPVGNDDGQTVRQKLEPPAPTALDSVSPGLWRLTVVYGMNKKLYVHPTPIAVAAGGTVEVTVSFRLRAGTVLVSDETGAPLANHRIVIRNPTWPYHVASVTDSEGKLDLEFPDQAYEARDLGPVGKRGGRGRPAQNVKWFSLDWSRAVLPTEITIDRASD